MKDLIASLQQEQPEADMKSPFTGGKVIILSREEEITFRGEKIKVTRKYYRCEDTGRDFTDSKLDDDMMWAAFRAYCEKKGITSFTDIMLKQEQPEVNLEKEIEKYLLDNADFITKSTSNEMVNALARHFYELGQQNHLKASYNSLEELRKEVIKFNKDHFDELHSDMDTIDIIHIVASHFAEWGAIHLNARKEE